MTINDLAKLRATGTGTTYGAQLTSLQSTFNALTDDEKLHSYLKVGNIVAPINNIGGVYTQIGVGDTSALAVSYRFNDLKCYAITLSSSGNNLSDTTNSDAPTISLYA